MGNEEKRTLSFTLHRWIVATMLMIVAGSIGTWWLTQDPDITHLKIGTASQGGMYHALINQWAINAKAQKALDIIPVSGNGSVHNRQRLLEDDIDAAIVQAGSVPLDGLAVVTPLYREAVHIVARTDLEIDQLPDLKNRTLVVGPTGSGMQISAQRILEHYHLENQVQIAEGTYFTEMLTDESLEGAIITSGIFNRDLNNLLSSGSFQLIPIFSAEAISAKDAYLHPFSIPAGFYQEKQRVPDTNLPTVATTALLVVRNNAEPKLVRTLLESLYSSGLTRDFPSLIPYNDVIDSSPVPLQETAHLFFRPPDHLGFIANLMESLVAIKELLVALVAGIWLIWDRWERLKQKERETFLQAQKDHLDEYLKQTLVIEEAQLNTQDPKELYQYLDQITQIKLAALKELTDEELRGDQSFTIFITQCANLINKIHFKIMIQGRNAYQGLESPTPDAG